VRCLSGAGLVDRFDAIVTGDEVPNGKPAPDIFLLAAGRLGVEPAACLVLEDSHNGIRAAHAAGCIPVMVPDLLGPTEEIERLAYRVLPSLANVAELLGTLVSIPEESLSATQPDAPRRR
jgi:beta-phosphoglucomutase-like phosphatase (HAD superfamily)